MITSRAQGGKDLTVYEDGLPVPRRYWAIAAMVMSLVLAVFDTAIASVALPTMARELAAAPAQSIWIVNAYQVAVVGALLPLASLGEIVGFRRISVWGLILFTAASLACVFAPTLLTLCAARVFQGVGAAAIMSVNGALVRFTYPHSRLGFAIGVTAMVTATSSAAGPMVAGLILAIADWRWLFAINVPIGLAAALIAWRNLPYNPLHERRLNWTGAALNAATLGLLVIGLQNFSDDRTYGLGALCILAALGLGFVLVRRESGRANPLIPLDLLRIPILSLSLVTSICCFSAQMFALISLPFDLQQRLGFSAAETGLLLTPWPVAVAVAAPIVGRLSDRWPAAVLGGIGLVVMALGLSLLATLPSVATPADFVWRMVICGLGFGMFQTPNNRIILGTAPRERSGAAGGLLGTARLIGQSLGAVGVALCFHFGGASPAFWALTAGAVAAALAGAVSFSRLLAQSATSGS